MNYFEDIVKKLIEFNMGGHKTQQDCFIYLTKLGVSIQNADKAYLTMLERTAPHKNLRDEFAMVALQGLLSRVEYLTDIGVSNKAYEIANEMMLRRLKK